MSEAGSYEQIHDSFALVPATYLPALLIELVSQCVKRKVFREGGLMKVVSKAIQQAEKLPQVATVENLENVGGTVSDYIQRG